MALMSTCVARLGSRFSMILDPIRKQVHYGALGMMVQKIGEMVVEALKKETSNYKDLILNDLTPISEEVKINDNYGEMMILNSAFLIKNTNEPEFDKVVNELDEKFGRFMTFKYVGTLPPYNFVNLSINTKGI